MKVSHAILVKLALGAAAILSGCGAFHPHTAASVPRNSRAYVPAIQANQIMTINSREDFMSGKGYGNTGAYEKLSGTIQGELDPRDPRNRVIQDLSLAPVNDRGMVEYGVDFVMLKPKDMSKAGGVMRYDAPNRGNIITMLNPNAVPGDRVFLEKGYVILYSAWQGDVPKSSRFRLTARVPVAKNPDGSSITGSYRAELLPTTSTAVMTLPGGEFNQTMMPYAPATLDNTQPGFALTKRLNETDPRETIPASEWKFSNCDKAGVSFPGTPDPGKICLKRGFVPGYIYELVYVAKDPLVMGVGFAALRDTVSFFRGKLADANGTANPVAGSIRHVIGQGTSQAGNAMKSFLHLGFNQALGGGKVFDGLYAHVAPRQTNVNARFAVPGSGGGLRTDHTAFGYAAPRGLDKDYVDDVAQRKGGVMRRCSETLTCPKFFLGLSGSEFWQLQASPILTEAQGRRDLVQPDNVRIYYYAGAQHGGAGGLASITWNPAADVYPSGTVVHFNDTFRALFIKLEEWVVKDLRPPDSKVPQIADRTLVRPEELKFPVMAGLTWPSKGRQTPVPRFNYLGYYNNASLLDFGPQYRHEDESGIATRLPPANLKKEYAILVPQVSPVTGLPTAGIQSVELQAPLGTSIEFNYVAKPGIVDLSNLRGSYIPFHKTEAERIAAGDTRPSLKSLYGSQAGYLAAVKEAAHKLVSQGFLLQQDAERLIRQAQDTVVLP